MCSFGRRRLWCSNGHGESETCHALPSHPAPQGEYAGGLRNGWGSCRFYNGDYYEGQWAKGLRDGHGMQQASGARALYPVTRSRPFPAADLCHLATRGMDPAS